MTINNLDLPGRKCARLGMLVLLFTTLATFGSSNIFATFGEKRSLSLYNIHNSETLQIVYKRNGEFVPGAQEKLNWFMRDWRTNEPTKMDPQLFDILWEIHTELGSRKPIHLISGYRSRKTNNKLRRRRGGQAKNSRHILGKATDVHFPDIPARKLRYSALVRERGGVGYYPNSALPFVHIDTGRVRYWPRMPRYELALLFPNGRTKYIPRDGRPITKKDVRIAKERHKEMARRITAFHEFRTTPKNRTMVASLDPIANLLSRPRLMGLGGRTLASAKLTPTLQPPRPNLLHRASDRIGLQIRLAALDPKRTPMPSRSKAQPRVSAPINPPLPARQARNIATAPNDRINWPTGWAGSPEYDEEHPDELSYRPFAVAPLLTTSSSMDDPVLSYLSHPDNKEIMETIATGDGQLPLKFQPGLQFAELLWADRFAGNAVAVSHLLGHKHDRTGRPVHTALQ